MYSCVVSSTFVALAMLVSPAATHTPVLIPDAVGFPAGFLSGVTASTSDKAIMNNAVTYYQSLTAGQQAN